jgi:hypothetical protein
MAKDAKKPVKRCESGDELLPFELPVKTTDTVGMNVFICNANARARAWYEELPAGQAKLIFDETGQSEFSVALPKLPPGRYLVRWSYLTASPDWKTKTEVTVQSTPADPKAKPVVRYRHKKAADGDNPVNMGMLVLEVA